MIRVGLLTTREDWDGQIPAMQPAPSETEDMINGWPFERIMENGVGITYSDFNVYPGHISFPVDLVSLESEIVKGIKVKVPLISSPMDTVTESRMAITMALNGGLGVIHGNFKNPKDQVKEVMKVKAYRIGFVINPICVGFNDNVNSILEKKAAHGFKTYPVTADGKHGSTLLGVITKEHYQKIKQGNIGKIYIFEIMTPIKEVFTVRAGTTASEALKHMKKKRIDYVPIINEMGDLLSLAFRSDLEQTTSYPNASFDANNELLVAAATNAHEESMDQIRHLASAQVDILVLPFICRIPLIIIRKPFYNSSNGSSDYQTSMIRCIKKYYPELKVVGGNVVTATQARTLIHIGVDALRVGMGSGSNRFTGKVCAVGRAHASSVYHVKCAAHPHGVPVWADGGIRNVEFMTKALVVGADAVMIGGMIAGTDETSGEYILNCNGECAKCFGKMESREATVTHTIANHQYSESGYTKESVTQGVGAKRSVNNLIMHWVREIQHGLQELGTRSIPALHQANRDGKLRAEIRTAGSRAEGDLHSFDA